jgi:hypothetical protein
MYDSNLDQLEVQALISESLKEKEKFRKYNFVM